MPSDICRYCEKSEHWNYNCPVLKNKKEKEQEELFENWENKNNFEYLRTMIQFYQKKKKDGQTKMCVPPCLQLDIAGQKM